MLFMDIRPLPPFPQYTCKSLGLLHPVDLLSAVVLMGDLSGCPLSRLTLWKPRGRA